MPKAVENVRSEVTASSINVFLKVTPPDNVQFYKIICSCGQTVDQVGQKYINNVPVWVNATFKSLYPYKLYDFTITPFSGTKRGQSVVKSITSGQAGMLHSLGVINIIQII